MKEQQKIEVLFQAITDRNTKAIKAYLKEGGDPNVPNGNGETALHCAAQQGFSKAIEQLTKAGADVNARNDQGATPLHHAARNGHGYATESLLKAGAEKHPVDAAGKSPAQLAADNLYCVPLNHLCSGITFGGTPDFGPAGYPKYLTLSKYRQSNYNKRSKHVYCEIEYRAMEDECCRLHPIFTAVKNGDLVAIADQLADQLTVNGEDVNVRDIWGKTPLMAAVTAGKADVVDYLLKQTGTNPNIMDSHEQTPLLEATWERKRTMIEPLLQHDADPLFQDAGERTVLIDVIRHFSASRNSKPGLVESVQLLIDAGADVDPDFDQIERHSPLYEAAFKFGNKRDMAIKQQFKEVVERLARHGANPKKGYYTAAFLIDKEPSLKAVADRREIEYLSSLVAKAVSRVGNSKKATQTQDDPQADQKAARLQKTDERLAILETMLNGNQSSGQQLPPVTLAAGATVQRDEVSPRTSANAESGTGAGQGRHHCPKSHLCWPWEHFRALHARNVRGSISKKKGRDSKNGN